MLDPALIMRSTSTLTALALRESPPPVLVSFIEISESLLGSTLGDLVHPRIDCLLELIKELMKRDGIEAGFVSSVDLAAHSQAPVVGKPRCPRVVDKRCLLSFVGL
jgi:hypothetical protein